MSDLIVMPLLKPTKKLVERYRREFEDKNRAEEQAIVDKILKAYQRQDRFSSQPLGDLKDYRRFKQVLKEFVNYYDLRGLGFRALDCFLHDYGKEALDKLANGTL